MHSNQDLVSVIMSVYNDEENIGNAIKSILDQTYKNLEILIIDDGSTDNSKNVLKFYEKKDKRIILLKNDINLGLTKSLNILIEKANGTYIARQDSDDISKTNRIEKQITFMKSHDLDACSSKALIKGSNKVIPRYSYYFPISFVLRYKNPVIHGTLILKSNVFEKIGKYDEEYVFSQDYELMIRLQKKNLNMKIYKEKLYILNMEDNISSKHKVSQEEFARKARLQYLNKNV